MKGEPSTCYVLHHWLGSGDMQDNNQLYCGAELLPLELLTLSLDH